MKIGVITTSRADFGIYLPILKLLQNEKMFDLKIYALGMHLSEKFGRTVNEIKKEGFYDEVSQAFCVYLPVKSVGVVGDERRYADVIALRAVKTIDFMTAEWSKLPFDFLAKVSNRIVNELEEVSRVVYDISGKPPATIEWE